VSERTPIDLDSGFVRAFYNPIAAMPSLHVGLAPIVGGALGMLLPGYVGRLVAIAYPALVTISVIVTGNHYILDVVGGLAVVGPATAIAALISGPNGLAELHAAARW
jgi:membrane-associated phospholipid phosphatase